MYCGKCGNKLAENNNYCNRCGAAIVNKNNQLVSPPPKVENIDYNEVYYEEATEEVINVENNKKALEIVFLTMTVAIAAILIISKLTSNII